MVPHSSPTKVIMITSSKGGVGKTTVCANLAMTLAVNGQHVLVIDLDMDNHCLDLILGLENQVIYHLLDVLNGVVAPDRAIIRHERCQNLHFLSAPSRSDYSDNMNQMLAQWLNHLAESGCYDVILLDTPGTVGQSLTCAAAVATDAIIVSTAQATAIRGAGLTGDYLTQCGVEQQQLIVNQFFLQRKNHPIAQDQLSLIDIIDRTAIPMIGVIPFCQRIWKDQNRGVLIDDDSYRRTDFACAFRNIAARISGQKLSLMQGMHGR